VTLVAVGLEQVTSAVRQRHGTVVRAERRRADQPFVLETLDASPRALGIVADVVKITLGDDPKRADRRQRAALGAVDLVDALTVVYLLSIAPARKVEIPREHVT
jgi:hypothetical protein